MLPGNACAACAYVSDYWGGLSQAERRVVAAAVDTRKQEFATGRFLAKAAIGQLGKDVEEILRGKRNQPIWPESVVGSISHTSDLCVAAVLPAAMGTTIGIDIENIADFDDALTDIVSHEVEIAERPANRPVGEQAALLLSIREAIFKAYYPATGYELDFKDVLIEIEENKFNASIVSDKAPKLLGKTRINGHIQSFYGLAVATAYSP